MKIKNLTTQKTLTNKAIFAKSLKEKVVGLIGKKPQAMIFKTRFGIHTFFMSYPIDIIILDKHKKVVKIKENLKPNKFFFWNPKYNLILELPDNTIKKSQTSLKNKISLISE